MTVPTVNAVVRHVVAVIELDGLDDLLGLPGSGGDACTDEEGTQRAEGSPQKEDEDEPEGGVGPRSKESAHSP